MQESPQPSKGRGAGERKGSAQYVKIVEWSEEDECYIGTSPGFMDGGCHGDDETAVYAELCDIVEEVIELYRADGKPLPPPTAGNGLAERVFERHLADGVGSAAVSG